MIGSSLTREAPRPASDRSRRRGGRPGTRASFRPGFEPLEQREVPAVVTFQGGLLTVGLADEADHNVTISRVMTKSGLAVTIDGQSDGLVAGATEGRVHAAEVRQIVVTGDQFGNRIGLAGVTSAAFAGLDNRVFVFAGGGDDYVVGSQFADILYGGDGNDTLDGVDGADRILGEAGADTLLGNSGNDILQGGDGKDSLNGGHDNDILLGGRGADRLKGSYDNDVLVGGAGADVVDGSVGADRFLVDASDTIYLFASEGDRRISRSPQLPEIPVPWV